MRKLFGIAILFATLGYAQPVTRTVHLVNTSDPRALQEAATVLRTVCDINDLSVDTQNSSITVTAQPATVALAVWTLTAVDTSTPMTPQQYSVPGRADDIVKVMYLTNTAQGQGMQELLTQLRTVLDVAKVFNAPSALVFRGNASMIAASTWLIGQLDQPFRPNATTASYEMQGIPDGDQVRVYYLHNIASPKPTQELLTAIRTQIHVVHTFVSTAPRAIAVRATSDQIVAADALVAKLDVPPAK